MKFVQCFDRSLYYFLVLSLLLLQFVFSTFPNTAIVDEHATTVNFEIPRESIARMSQAFRSLEEMKAALGIVDYALSQSTLEQVRPARERCIYV